MLSLVVCEYMLTACNLAVVCVMKFAEMISLLRTTFYDGVRPGGYDPRRKEGAIVLGVGGDNTDGGEGEYN